MTETNLNSQMTAGDSDEFIYRMFSKVELIRLTGAASGSVLVSPKDAVDAASLHLDKKKDYWEFKIEMAKGAKNLHPLTSYKMGQNIYRGGIDFPPCCVACMKPAEKYILAEAKLNVQSSGRLSINESDNEKAQRIFSGLCNARHWYAVPFCGEHGPKDKAISFETSKGDNIKLGDSIEANGTLTVRIANVEYGRMFMRQTGKAGVWAVRSAFGPILMNSPEERARLDASDKGWKKKLVRKRGLLQLLNWSSLLLVVFILAVLKDITLPVLEWISGLIEGNLVLIVIALVALGVLLSPWFIFSSRINKTGNFPFEKKTK